MPPMVAPCLLDPDHTKLRLGRRPIYRLIVIEAGGEVPQAIRALADEGRVHPVLPVMRWIHSAISVGDVRSLRLTDYRNGSAVRRGCSRLL